MSDDDAALAGDSLLHAVRRDMLALFKSLDQKLEAFDARVEALDGRIDARLHDTVPLWEGVVSRLDAIATEQVSQGTRLGAIAVEQRNQRERLNSIEAEQGRQGARLDAIEARLDAMDRELRHLGRRVDRAVAELSGEVVKSRMDQHDLEDRVEKLEKSPA